MSRLILLLSGFTLLCGFSLDEPVIMERIVHRVDWDEVLLEYDASVAPNRNMTITINAHLVAYSYEINILKVIYDVDTSWEDPRLRISPGVKVSIPPSIRIWKPNIIVQNAVSDEILVSTQLFSKEKFRLHQRRLMELARSRKMEEKPDFVPFEDGSADNVDLNTTVQGLRYNEIVQKPGWLYLIQ